MTVIDKLITTEILVAYSHYPCQTYLQLCTGEKGTFKFCLNSQIRGICNRSCYIYLVRYSWKFHYDGVTI